MCTACHSNKYMPDYQRLKSYYKCWLKSCLNIEEIAITFVNHRNYDLLIDDIPIPRRPWDERLHSMIARQKRKRTLVSLVSRGSIAAKR